MQPSSCLADDLKNDSENEHEVVELEHANTEINSASKASARKKKALPEKKTVKKAKNSIFPYLNKIEEEEQVTSSYGGNFNSQGVPSSPTTGPAQIIKRTIAEALFNYSNSSL